MEPGRESAALAFRPGGLTTPIRPPVDLRGKLPIRPGTNGRYPGRDLAAVDSVDLHYTAGPSTSTVQAIAAYQTGPKAQEPFPAIAYHLIVDNRGAVSWCHDLDRRVWHNGAPGRNERAIGICYIGDREPNAAQKRGIQNAIRWCQQQIGRTLIVAGHKDQYATSCPGPTWPTWRRDVLP